MPDRAVRIDEIGIGAAEVALLLHHLAAEILRRMNLAHKTLVALHHLRRNEQRHRGNAPAADAEAHAEAAGALRKEAEPRARAVVDLDAADMAVGVGIKLDVVLARRAAVFRHLDEAARAANAERRGRRRDLHVAGLGDGSSDESGGALGDVEYAGIVLAAVFIDVGVDGDLRVGLEIEGGGIDEGDAERRVRRRPHHVVEIDVVLDLERRGRVVADHAGGADHGGDVADRFFRRLGVGGGCGGIRRCCRRLRGLGLRQLNRIGRRLRNGLRVCWHTADQQQKRGGKQALHHENSKWRGSNEDRRSAERQYQPCPAERGMNVAVLLSRQDRVIKAKRFAGAHKKAAL